MARKRIAVLALLLLALAGCATRANGFYYYENGSFRTFDVSRLAVGAAPADTADLSALEALPDAPDVSSSAAEESHVTYHNASVTARMLNVYSAPNTASRVAATVQKGDVLSLAYYSDAFFLVKKAGLFLGYCETGGAMSGVWDNYYGVLPPEEGMAPNAAGELVPAKSHLVDVRLYTDRVVVKMKLATSGTTIGRPFYNRNLCMLEEDTIPKLLQAIDLFAADGYTIVIYDAYRPTSVQQQWFDVVRVHKWVADPSIGMGGIHDRGVAVDMTLMDRNGVEMDMPTAMHTLTEAASRWSPLITETQRANINYMTNIMTRCGFTYINSEWWHFQDSEIVHYLPTDHPIDEIPLVYREVKR